MIDTRFVKPNDKNLLTRIQHRGLISFRIFTF